MKGKLKVIKDSEGIFLTLKESRESFCNFLRVIKINHDRYGENFVFGFRSCAGNFKKIESVKRKYDTHIFDYIKA